MIEQARFASSKRRTCRRLVCRRLHGCMVLQPKRKNLVGADTISGIKGRNEGGGHATRYENSDAFWTPGCAVNLTKDPEKCAAR